VGLGFVVWGGAKAWIFEYANKAFEVGFMFID
jgi:hypothetical protein